mmetsp:Transcript_16692/g.29846  ORF Transcript_16692/g.29846 Transcript_16692/m.29846 type:complete len:242 (-) Transcript_16692:431-1156(-)
MISPRISMMSIMPTYCPPRSTGKVSMLCADNCLRASPIVLSASMVSKVSLLLPVTLQILATVMSFSSQPLLIIERRIRFNVIKKTGCPCASTAYARTARAGPTAATMSARVASGEMMTGVAMGCSFLYSEIGNCNTLKSASPLMASAFMAPISLPLASTTAVSRFPLAWARRRASSTVSCSVTFSSTEAVEVVVLEMRPIWETGQLAFFPNNEGVAAMYATRSLCDNVAAACSPLKIVRLW